jgi:hypothetical protein
MAICRLLMPAARFSPDAILIGIPFCSLSRNLVSRSDRPASSFYFYLFLEQKSARTCAGDSYLKTKIGDDGQSCKKTSRGRKFGSGVLRVSLFTPPLMSASSPVPSPLVLMLLRLSVSVLVCACVFLCPHPHFVQFLALVGKRSLTRHKPKLEWEYCAMSCTE